MNVPLFSLGFVEGIGANEWLMILLVMVLPALWVWRDTLRNRVPGGHLWGALVLFTGLFGLAAYLAVRKWSRGATGQ